MAQAKERSLQYEYKAVSDFNISFELLVLNIHAMNL